MKNTLAAIAVFLAGLMNLPYITEEILKIPPKRIIVENTDRGVIGLELLEESFCSEEEPVIGLELREYPNEDCFPYQDFTPSNVEEPLVLNTFVRQPTCINKPCVVRQRCGPLKWIHHRRPIRRLLGCFGVRYYRCKKLF